MKKINLLLGALAIVGAIAIMGCKTSANSGTGSTGGSSTGGSTANDANLTVEEKAWKDGVGGKTFVTSKDVSGTIKRDCNQWKFNADGKSGTYDDVSDALAAVKFTIEYDKTKKIFVAKMKDSGGYDSAFKYVYDDATKSITTYADEGNTTFPRELKGKFNAEQETFMLRDDVSHWAFFAEAKQFTNTEKGYFSFSGISTNKDKNLTGKFNPVGGGAQQDVVVSLKTDGSKITEIKLKIGTGEAKIATMESDGNLKYDGAIYTKQ